MDRIKFDYNGSHYELGYSRESVKQIEAQGFSLEKLTSQPVTMIPLLFYGAFALNHRGIKRKQVDEIWDKIKSEDLVQVLTEMYSETVSDLLGLDGESNPNQIVWERG